VVSGERQSGQRMQRVLGADLQEATLIKRMLGGAASKSSRPLVHSMACPASWSVVSNFMGVALKTYPSPRMLRIIGSSFDP
jgi:hypothetical protein